jgi:hypothetical protein
MLHETRIGELVEKNVYKHAPNVEKTDAAQSFYQLIERYSLRQIVSEHGIYSHINKKQTRTVLQCERGNTPCGV